MKSLTDQNENYWLQSGKLTKPFLPIETILTEMDKNQTNPSQQDTEMVKLENLFHWIYDSVRFGDQDFNHKYRFKRTAKEIWESKLVTGCTDYATLFATFARQIGIPTTILHTAERNWIKRLQNKEECSMHYGHTFCECYVHQKWILVDPTFRKIEYEYNPNQLELSYKVGGNSIFIPYLRDFDLQKKMTTRKHNRIMDKMCKPLKV